jgi:hypothetical protein
MNSLADVLSLLAASYATPEKVVTRNDPTYVKVERKPKGESKAKVAEKTKGQQVFDLGDMPTVGSLTAEQFLKDGLCIQGENGRMKILIHGIRNAGKRDFLGHNSAGQEIPLIRVEEKHVRGDTIKAIHAYVGYDPKGEYGSQLQAASAKASIAVGARKTNGLTRSESRFVAKGQPEDRKTWGVAKDTDGDRLTHLRASEPVIVTLIIEAQKTAREAYQMAVEAKEAEALEMAEACVNLAAKAQQTVVIESARLQQVRKDLLALEAGAVRFQR